MAHDIHLSVQYRDHDKFVGFGAIDQVMAARAYPHQARQAIIDRSTRVGTFSRTLRDLMDCGQISIRTFVSPMP